jgi:HEAT repeat protein
VSETLSELLNKLSSSDVRVRIRTKESLLAMGAAVIEPLIELARKDAGRASWEAASVLAQIDDPRCLELMIDSLTTKDLMLGHIAVDALEKQQPPRIITALINALPVAHHTLQPRIVGALEKAGDPQAVRPLMDLLGKTDSSLLRLCAIQALGVLGDVQAIDLIRLFENNEDHHVQKRARIALQRLDNLPKP